MLGNAKPSPDVKVARYMLVRRRSFQLIGGHAALRQAVPLATCRLLSTKVDQKSGVNTRHPGGVPDWIHLWTPAHFYKGGYGLIGLTATSAVLTYVHEMNVLVPPLLAALTAGYWSLGLSDLQQKHQALRRNFPVLIHIRYMLESIRPEIQQYLIESDNIAAPFSREARTLVYNRSKGLPDTTAFGTKRNVYLEGHEWAAHSLFPKHLDPAVAGRVTIGGKLCKQPYSASLFNVSAMSYGALSGNAVSALNLGAQIAGCYHNTGEGGISRFHKLGGDIVWNVGTGYFACGYTDKDGVRRWLRKATEMGPDDPDCAGWPFCALECVCVRLSAPECT